MLDGDLAAVSVPDAGVDGAEPSLAEDVANPVSPFKGLARGYADLVLKTWKDVFVISSISYWNVSTSVRISKLQISVKIWQFSLGFKGLC